MPSQASTISPGVALTLESLITLTERGIASRVLAKGSGGSVTLFAFDRGEELSEHTSPFEALVLVLEGTLRLTIDGRPADAQPGTIVRMPAHVPHAVEAVEPARMLLIMLMERKPH